MSTDANSGHKYTHFKGDLMNIKPIETRYNGYKFRSRLEARWAVFFDAVGIQYEYEKEGYDLGTLGYYLPDFWIPRNECFIEIKGQHPTKEELDKIEALHKLLRTPCILFYGQPCSNNGFAYFKDGSESGNEFQYSDEVNLVGREDVVCFDMFFKSKAISHVINRENKTLDYYVNRKYAAYRGMSQDAKVVKRGLEDALSARFEYGETPNKKNTSAYGNNFFKKGFRSRHCNNCYFFEKFEDGGGRGQCTSNDRILRHGLLDSGNQAIVKESYYCHDFYLPIKYGKEKYKCKI